MWVGGHWDHSLPPHPHFFCPPCCTPSTETCAWKGKEAAKGHLRFTAAGVGVDVVVALALALYYRISLGREEGRGVGDGMAGGGGEAAGQDRAWRGEPQTQ